MTDRFYYVCTESHSIVSPRPLDKCLAYDKGCPCKGELIRIGPGSRKRQAA